MLGLSYKEFTHRAKESTPFLPTNLTKSNLSLSRSDLYKFIWRGSFPRLLKNEDTYWSTFYKSYIKTYLDRDIRDFLGIRDSLKFNDFLRSLAARTGNRIVQKEIANDIGIDLRTVSSWTSALERSGIIKILEPYTPNITGRIVQTPKLYFLDTGLASYLAGWDTSESLMNGAQNGAMLETFAFIEILKSYYHNGEDPNIYFYRDKDGKEIDFIIEKNMTLYPIEIKRTAMPSSNSVSNFKVLHSLKGKIIGKGVILCLSPETTTIRKDIMIHPIWDI